MFEIIDAAQVPGLERKASLPALPIATLEVGSAIRLPIAGMSPSDAARVFGAIRTRVCRARSATGNDYIVTKASDALYIARMA